jgi:cytochrome c peroxidase
MHRLISIKTVAAQPNAKHSSQSSSSRDQVFARFNMSFRKIEDKGMIVRVFLPAATGLAMALLLQHALAFPVVGEQTPLPVGTELNDDALEQPREEFHSEAIEGRKPYLVKLGNMAFNTPAILGGRALKGGISCGTCHVNGASNPKLFITGASTRPGNFDISNSLFNPKAENSVLDPVRIPSLRGARYLAPYGNDGRTESLRDFVRTVIIDEFAGPDPAPAVLDGLVAYILDIDFLPNPRLALGGKLTADASESERRGEALFNKPFPHDAGLSCAGCHLPSGAFVDHRQHDVGSGGLYKTPTLLNADFNAPYFHDARFNTLDQVVSYFDRSFELGFSAQDRADLVAYLKAIGDGTQPYERINSAIPLQDIFDFASVLATAIPAHDNDIISLAVNAVGGDLSDLRDRIPDQGDPVVSGGEKERDAARGALNEIVAILGRIGSDAAGEKYDDAGREYRNYNHFMTVGVQPAVGRAEPWSLFNPAVRDAHYVRRQLESNKKQSAR